MKEEIKRVMGEAEMTEIALGRGGITGNQTRTEQ